MKQILVSMAVLLSVVYANATSILPVKGPIAVHQVHTGLRSNGSGGLLGPISIIRGNNYGEANVIVNQNACTVDGMCTLMASYEFDAEISFLNETDEYESYTVKVLKPQSGIVADQYVLKLFFEDSKASLEEGNTILEAKSYTWVAKSDSSISCYNEGISLSDMATEIKNLGVELRSMRKGTTGAILPSVCGIHTSRLNVYLIPSAAMADVDAIGFIGWDLFPYAQFIY